MRREVTHISKGTFEPRIFRFVAVAYLLFPALLGLWADCLMKTTCYFIAPVVTYMMFPNTVFVLLFAVLSLWWFERLFWGILFLLIVPWTALVLVSVTVG